MHFKLNSPSPTIEKTTTTELTFTIEIVKCLVLFYKWITHINYIEIITDLCLYLYNIKTNRLKSEWDPHLNRNVYKGYVARFDFLY